MLDSQVQVKLIEIASLLTDKMTIASMDKTKEPVPKETQLTTWINEFGKIYGRLVKSLGQQ